MFHKRILALEKAAQRNKILINLTNSEVNPTWDQGMDYKTFWDPFQPKLFSM